MHEKAVKHTNSTQNPLLRVRVVLVEPSHTGNIGAVARALKNMGLCQLTLVNPRAILDDAAFARAGHAKDVLEAAQIVPDLASAIADCQMIYATRGRDTKLKWPKLEARACAAHVYQQLVEPSAQVAILFGPERTGLQNEHLVKSHFHVVIPTHSEYPSINLAQAVQIMAYELLMAGHSPVSAMTEAQESHAIGASQQAMEYFYTDLEDKLLQAGYIVPESGAQTMARFRRIFQRAQLTQEEIQLLTGSLRVLGKSPGMA